MKEDITISLDCVEAIGHAKQYLIRHKVRKLPVDVFELCRRDKIDLIPFRKSKCSLLKKKTTFVCSCNDGTKLNICFNDRDPMEEQEWGIACGIGYIMNGCCGKTKWNPTNEKSKIKAEKENASEIFAMIILGRALYNEEDEEDEEDESG